jgi:Ca-activated chloride channel family protein
MRRSVARLFRGVISGVAAAMLAAPLATTPATAQGSSRDGARVFLDQLGLVTYGHHRKNDCSDIEVLRPVGPVDADALMAQVNGISPKGMTPMSAAVRLTAEQLKSSEGATGVILVSDGAETCHADPCAIAAELKKADVRLVVHTVGFDVQDRQAVKQLQCMAAATGGLALSASDAGELGKAIGQAVDAARKKDVAPTPPPKVEPKPEPKSAWNLEGSARLAEGDDPLAGKDAVVWQFSKPVPAGTAPEYLQTSYQNDIEAELPPGDYFAEVTAGAAKQKVPVKVEAGKMNRLDIVLNAGRLALRARRTADQNQTEGVFWEVVRRGEADAVYNSYNAETATIVPAGPYTVRMTLGAAKLSRVEIQAGQRTVTSIAFP